MPIELLKKIKESELVKKIKERQAPLGNIVEAAICTLISGYHFSIGDIKNGTDWADIAVLSFVFSIPSYVANKGNINIHNAGWNALGSFLMEGAYQVYPLHPIYRVTHFITTIQTILNGAELYKKRELDKNGNPGTHSPSYTRSYKLENHLWPTLFVRSLY